MFILKSEILGGRLFQNFKNSGNRIWTYKNKKTFIRRPEVGLVIPGHYKARTKSRSHCKILDRELNYMKTKYSHFEIEHELSEERILMPYVTSSK